MCPYDIIDLYFQNSVYTVAINTLEGNMKAWEIERLFNDDIREKRKTGSGSFSSTGERRKAWDFRRFKNAVLLHV